jgi:hypothetical protein
MPKEAAALIYRSALDAFQERCRDAANVNLEDGLLFTGFHTFAAGKLLVVLHRGIPGGTTTVRRRDWWEPEIPHEDLDDSRSTHGTPPQGSGHLHLDFPDSPSVADLRAARTLLEAGEPLHVLLLSSATDGVLNPAGPAAYLLYPGLEVFRPIDLYVREDDGSTSLLREASAPRPDRVVVLDTVVHGAIPVSTELLGRKLPNERLVQVLSTSRQPRPELPAHPIGWAGASPSFPQVGDIAVDGDAWRQLTTTGWAPVEPQVVSTRPEEISERALGLTHAATRKKTIVAFGAGSVVSATLSLLAHVVGKVVLIERDASAILTNHNLSRHECSLGSIARRKDLALRDLLLAKNPNLVVECHAINIHNEPEAVLELMKPADLVLASTDKAHTQCLIGELAYELDQKVVMPWAFDHAVASEIWTGWPGSPHSYVRTFPHRQRRGVERLRAQNAFDEGGAFNYQASPEDLVASPGLAADLGLLASVAACVCIQMLDEESSADELRPDYPSRARTDLVSLERPYLLLHSAAPVARYRHLGFERPLDSLAVTLEIGGNGSSTGPN